MYIWKNKNFLLMVLITQRSFRAAISRVKKEFKKILSCAEASGAVIFCHCANFFDWSKQKKTFTKGELWKKELDGGRIKSRLVRFIHSKQLPRMTERFNQYNIEWKSTAIFYTDVSNFRNCAKSDKVDLERSISFLWNWAFFASFHHTGLGFRFSVGRGRIVIACYSLLRLPNINGYDKKFNFFIFQPFLYFLCVWIFKLASNPFHFRSLCSP